MIAMGAGCARVPVAPEEASARFLYEQACGKDSPGVTAPEGVRGTVWLVAQSKEASGKFPAVVEVKPPGIVRMEVTNPLGGVEALIRVEGNRYFIEIPKEKPEYRKQEGSHSWGGIPLHWAARLFQGRLPCPPAVATAEMAMEMTKDGALSLQTQPALDREAELFVYRFRNQGSRRWPEALHWERKGIAPLTVDFKFDDPEDKTRSPRKWEAKSPMGEVKVRWREREWITGAHAAVEKAK